MAVLLTKTNTLVLHIPKCGGTFIESAIRMRDIPHLIPPPIGGECPRHGTKRNYRRAARTICFVRDPDAWIESWWRFFQCPPVFGRSVIYPYIDEIVPAHHEAGTGFDSLVRVCVRKYPGLVNRIFDRYRTGGVECFSVVDIDAKIAEAAEVDVERIRTVPLQNVSRPSRVPIWPEGLREEFLKHEHRSY